MSRLTAWSYSRWSTYEKCPLQAKYKYIDKLPEPASAAMERGSAVHDQLAAYLRGDIPRLGPNETAPITGWTYFAGLLNDLREMEPLVEQQWGFTDTLKQTGWFGSDTWFRSVLDVCLIYSDNTADVVDFKTGKPRPQETSQQAELYALSIVHRYPAVSHVTVRFWYVDLDQKGAEAVYRFSRDTLPDAKKKWLDRGKRMTSDTMMVPKPGMHCKWCLAAKSIGGPCKYG